MGHSVDVATKHYTQTTDEHFRKSLQNALQCGAASASTEPHAKSADVKKAGVLPADAASCSAVQFDQADEVGFEQVQLSSVSKHFDEQGEVKGEALRAADVGLQVVADRWPELTDKQQTAILSIVDPCV